MGIKNTIKSFPTMASIVYITVSRLCYSTVPVGYKIQEIQISKQVVPVPVPVPTEDPGLFDLI
jgi:hypothetical protein